MGDEFRGRSCPDCGERLAVDARRCVCGWGAKKAGKGEDGPRFDMVCRWRAGDLACHFPVGQFGHGEFRGLCIFHRAEDKGAGAVATARRSMVAGRQEYLEDVARLIYGEGDNPYVEKLRASLKSRRPGNIGAFAAPAAMREPGADEREGA